MAMPATSWPWMRMEPASSCCRPMINFKSTLFPVPLCPRIARVSPWATSRSTPSRTCWAPNDLRTDRTCTAACGIGAFIVCSREEHQDEAHQYDVSQDDENRGVDHGAGRRALHSCGAAFCPHALEARHQTDDHSEDRRLESGRQEIVETHAGKA